MSVWDSRLEAMGFLDNPLNRYTPRTPGKPVFVVIDTETTGFNKRYDRIIELVAVRADSHGTDPRKVDTSGASYAAVVSIAEVSVSQTSGATRLHQECRRRVL